MVPLTLAEQLLLLAIDDDTGKLLPMPDRAFDYALAGAILADLTRAGRIQVTRDEVVILDSTPVESVPEDFGLVELVQGESRTLRGALAHLAGDAYGLRKRCIEHLLEKGVLRRENHEFLWVFHYSRYPLADPESENAIRNRLRNRILSQKVPLSGPERAMISLIHACQLEYLLLSPEEQESSRERIERISRDDRIGKAVMGCLEEIQKAILEIRTYSGM